MLKACSISYTVNLVTPCVCVRGTVDKIFRPWQILWSWHLHRHYFRFSKLLSKRWRGSKEHYLLGRNTVCESLVKRITPKICVLCFVLINSILCNLLCVRVMFENANSPCFWYFFSLNSTVNYVWCALVLVTLNIGIRTLHSILCNLLCVRVMFENANSPCFWFFFLLNSTVNYVWRALVLLTLNIGIRTLRSESTCCT